jgi:hypothetical protein
MIGLLGLVNRRTKKERISDRVIIIIRLLSCVCELKGIFSGNVAGFPATSWKVFEVVQGHVLSF